MTPSSNTEENSDKRRSIGPGDRLQAERIKQSLSIEDVARRMHLSVGILQAIEENNFDDITAPIFVKGYLRAYAKIVFLDEDEMIQQYLDYYSDEDPPISSTSNLAPEISSDDARIKWVTYLVVIGLLALFAVWWWNQYQIKTDVVSLDAELSDSMLQAETTSGSSVSKIEIATDTSLSVSEEIDISLVPVDEPEVAVLMAVTERQEVINLEPPEQVSIEVAQGEVIQQKPELADQGVLSKEISRMAPTGAEQFKMLVHADTWVDIKDGSGYQLVFELIRAEYKLNMTGKPPFEVFLGNGHGVELIYNNETIDISSRIKGNNTARLKIGPG